MNVEPIKDVVAAGLLALAVLLVITVIGRHVLALLGVGKSLRPVAPALGLAVILAVAWPLQWIGVPFQAIAAFAILTAILGVAIPLVATSRALRRPDILTVCASDVLFPLIGFLTAVAFFYPALRDHGLSLASLGNGDPLSYSLQARQTLESGFQPSPGVTNWDFNLDARAGWSGAGATLALVAGITGRSVGTAFLLTMIIVLTIGQWQTSVLIRRLASGRMDGRRRTLLVALGAALISALAWFNPFVAYVAGNGFLAQVVAMALLAPLLVVLLSRASEHKESIAGKAVVLGLLVGAACSAYGALGPAVAATLAGIWVAALLLTNWRRPWLKLSRPAGIALAVATLTGIAGFLWFSMDGVLITTTMAAGWPMHVPSFAAIFGIAPFLTDSGVAVDATGALGWAVLAMILIILPLNVTQRGILSRIRFVAGCVTLIILAGAVAAFGVDAYRTWKLWGMIVPILVVAVGSTALAMTQPSRAVRSRSASVALVVLLLTAIGLTVNGVRLSSNEWSQSRYTYGASSEQVALTFSPPVRSLSGVDIKGSSPSETMLMMIYAGAPSRNAISPSFFPPLPARYPHLLTTTALAASYPPDWVTTLNSQYALVKTGTRNGPKGP
jgi:hypothetical protein